jgi:hypothetical protein
MLETAMSYSVSRAVPEIRMEGIFFGRRCFECGQKRLYFLRIFFRSPAA